MRARTVRAGWSELMARIGARTRRVLNRGINVLADAKLTLHNRPDETLQAARGGSARRTLRISRGAGPRSLGTSGDVRTGDAAATRRRPHASGLFLGGGRHAGGTDHVVFRIPLPARYDLRRAARPYRYAARPRWPRGQRAARGSPGRGGCSRGGAGDGRVPAPAGRPEPVQRSATPASRADPFGARARRLGRRAPRGRSVGASPRAPGRQERASSHARLSQGAGCCSRGGDRTAAAGGGAPRPATIRGGTGGGGVALRLRQCGDPAPRLPPRLARDAVRLPRALFRAAGARLMSLVNRKIHPSFAVAGAVFVVLLCAAAVRATPSILIVPLEREFGWSRAVLL